MIRPLTIVALILVLVGCSPDDTVTQLPEEPKEQKEPQICLPTEAQLPTEAYQGAAIDGELIYFLTYRFEYKDDRISTIRLYDYDSDELTTTYRFAYADDRLSTVVMESILGGVRYLYEYTDQTLVIDQRQFWPQINDTISNTSERFYLESPADGIHIDPLSDGRVYLAENGNFVQEGFYTVEEGDTTYSFTTTYFFDDNPNINKSPVYSYTLGTFFLYDVEWTSSANNVLSTEWAPGETYSFIKDLEFDQFDNFLSITYKNGVQYEFSYGCN